MRVLWDILQSSTSLPLLFLQFRAPPFSLSFPLLKHPLQASYPRQFLVVKLKDPASIEAPQASFHQVLSYFIVYFFTLNVFCAQSNHLNDVRIDGDWKVMILFGIEIGWLMCYDLGICFYINFIRGLLYMYQDFMIYLSMDMW